jgi:hypothetical protein
MGDRMSFATRIAKITIDKPAKITICMTGEDGDDSEFKLHSFNWELAPRNLIPTNLQGLISEVGRFPFD